MTRFEAVAHAPADCVQVATSESPSNTQTSMVHSRKNIPNLFL
jgi:hypothetical protein